MDKDIIDNLLEKYFEGETSLKEEEILQSYFSKDLIDKSHVNYQPLFNYFSKEREKPIKTTKRNNQILYTWLGIAASLLIIIGIWQKYHHVDKNRNQSMVYINGKEITDTKTINLEILYSIENVSDIDEDMINTQIGVLDSFTE